MDDAYILLRAALGLFKKSPADLTRDELQRVRRQANNEIAIENKILNTEEAIGVIIGNDEVQRAYAEIRGRYQDDSSFALALANNSLDETSLKAALYRQCKVNAILDKVGSRAPSVSDVDIGLYYHLHREKFFIPERRKVSHIFISINPDYPENTKIAAKQRAQELREKLLKKPHQFADIALKHSECPTALQGGDLGTVARGTLYPELDAVLFTLKLGEISLVTESEIGFHILKCKQIHPVEIVGLAKATPQILALMQERTQQTYSRTWLSDLLKGNANDS